MWLFSGGKIEVLYYSKSSVYFGHYGHRENEASDFGVSC